MNGAKYNYEDYAWEPESDTQKIAYYVADAPGAAAAAAQEAPLSADIVPATTQSVLSRPVGELIASARDSLNDSVLTKPVGELLSSARESLNDSVLTKPVGELLSSAREPGVPNRRLAL